MGTIQLTFKNVGRRSSEAMSEYAFRHARAQLGESGKNVPTLRTKLSINKLN
jgi:hypothetical protein